MKWLDWFKRKPPIAASQLPLDRSGTPGIVRPSSVRCPKCKNTVFIWRTYADGKILCVGCADKRR